MKVKNVIDYDNHQLSSLDDYYDNFSRMWSRDYNERSALDLWLHVVDHASRVAKAIRKQQPHNVLDDIADTTIWMFSFIAHCNNSINKIDESFKLNLTPSEIIWKKFPNICPLCFDFSVANMVINGKYPLDNKEYIVEFLSANQNQSTTCTCISRESKSEIELNFIRKNRIELDNIRILYSESLIKKNVKPKYIDGYQDMFDGIYKHINRMVSVEEMGFRLLEEVGEATQAFQDLYTYNDSSEPYTKELHEFRKNKLYDELADIFSWLFTIVLKLQSTYVTQAMKYIESINYGFIPRPEANSLSFSGIIWAKYGRTKERANLANLTCPGCKKSICSCPRDLKISWHLINFDKINNTAKYPPLPNETRDLVFISYSHKDTEWLDKLTTMLKPLVRNKTISAWDDNDIETGQKWEKEISSALLRTKVAVMLVSDNFLASDFIAENELPPLLESAKDGGTKIVWIPISSCLYDETDIRKYQAASNPNDPLDSMSKSKVKTELAKICKKIKQLS